MKKHLLMVPMIALVAAIGNIANAQVIDSTTFLGVMPDPTGGGDLHSYVLGSSGSMEALVFYGTITEINTATWGSEIEFSYAGSGASGSGNMLTATNGFTGTLDFQAFIPVDDGFGFPLPITSGDNWDFTFFETFDDGGDALVDASVDITFEFWDSEPVPAETDLGDFTLDDGFYDRGQVGDEDHPYTQVAFQVTGDGIYSLESDWVDPAGGSFDGYLFLLDSPFSGDDVPNIAFDDDGPEGLADSRIESVALQQGVTYYALMTTFGGQPGNSTLMGDLRVGNLFGNTAFLVVIPEPATGTAFAAMLLGGVFFTRRRRK